MLHLQPFPKEAEQENFDVENPFLIIPAPFSVLQDTAVTELCDIWLWQSLRLIWRPLNFIILFHTIPTDPAVSLYLLWPVWGWGQLHLVVKGPEQELEPELQLLCLPSCTSQGSDRVRNRGSCFVCSRLTENPLLVSPHVSKHPPLLSGPECNRKPHSGRGFHFILYSVLVHVRHLGNWAINLFFMLILGMFSPAFRIYFLKSQEETFWQLPSAGVYLWPLSDLGFQPVLVCACGNQGCWALLRTGSAAPLSLQLCLKSRRNLSPPSDGQSVSDRKPSAFHVPSGAGKSTKWKMVKVSCTVQQPKVPENRNWKFFWVHSSILLSLPHTPTR